MKFMKTPLSKLFLKRALWFFLLIQCHFCPRAFAYLDPGSGSFFYQMFLAFVLAVPFFFKSIWLKFVELVKKIFRRGKKK